MIIIALFRSEEDYGYVYDVYYTDGIDGKSAVCVDFLCLQSFAESSVNACFLGLRRLIVGQPRVDTSLQFWTWTV